MVYDTELLTVPTGTVPKDQTRSGIGRHTKRLKETMTHGGHYTLFYPSIL